MPYVEGRTVHDADAHIMEPPDWLFSYADPGVRERLKPIFVASVKPGDKLEIVGWRDGRRFEATVIAGERGEQPLPD